MGGAKIISMAKEISKGIAPGNLQIRILTTNESSAILRAGEKFAGKIIQPGAAAGGFLAEYGFGAYIEVNEGDAKHAILFDTGGLNSSILHNVKAMNVKLGDVEKVVISHGHFDHTGALIKVIPELKPGCEVIVHPSAFIQNHIVSTNTGEEVPLDDFAKNVRELKKAGKIAFDAKLPLLNKVLVEKLAAERGVKIVETTQPIYLCSGVVTSGEIEVTNPSEMTRGFYLLKSKNEVEKNTFRDEIALYMHIQGKGLAILTGCGHTGIVNIIHHGQKLTRINQIYTVIGGFHEEVNSEAEIEKEIQALKEFNPAIVCGMHCTGLVFNAKMLGSAAHVQGVVGTEFRL